MNDFPPHRTVVIAQAARLLESAGLRVLDRDWVSGRHKLDLVAISRQGVLVAVEVRAAAPGDPVADAAEITLQRAGEVRQAASAWMQAHGDSGGEVRIDIVSFYPDRSGGYTAEHVEEGAQMAAARTPEQPGVHGLVPNVPAPAKPGLLPDLRQADMARFREPGEQFPAPRLEELPLSAGIPGAVSLNDVLSETVAAARTETVTGLRAVEWREDEIARAISRHPGAENDLFHSNRIVLPAIISPAWDIEFVFRGHVREILERVAHGEDTRPGTAAECCIAMAEVNKAVPLHGAAAGFYHRMWQQAFPDHQADGKTLTDHYEAVRGQGIDQHERYVRRKLAVPGRRLDPARIECDGEHWGRAVTCTYQRI